MYRIVRFPKPKRQGFTDRRFGGLARGESGRHELALLCEALGIAHRFTRPRRAQTNGMGQQLNGRIEAVLSRNTPGRPKCFMHPPGAGWAKPAPGALRRHHCVSGEDLGRTRDRNVWLYNQMPPQAAPKGQTPVAAMLQGAKHTLTCSQTVRTFAGT